MSRVDDALLCRDEELDEGAAPAWQRGAQDTDRDKDPDQGFLPWQRPQEPLKPIKQCWGRCFLAAITPGACDSVCVTT